MTSIFDSISADEVGAVIALLQEDAKRANALRGDVTPLLWACQLGFPTIVRVLLDFRADAGHQNDEGETPLHVAAFEACDEIVEALLQAGADPSARTIDGKTPLMNAAQAGSLAVVQRLLDAGASALDMDAVHRTVLHWASLGKHDDAPIIHALLMAGANLSVANDNGDTALDYARLMKKEAITGRLGQNAASSN